MKQLYLFLLLIALCFGCNQKQNPSIGHSSTPTKAEEINYVQKNIAYNLYENSQVRNYVFENLTRNISLITFLDSELSYLKFDNKSYYNIAYDYGMEDDLDSRMLLFENKQSASLIFLFPSYSEEFPTFHVIEFTPSGIPTDHGIFTFAWQDFEKLEIRNFERVSYDVEKDGNTINILAKVDGNNSSALSIKNEFQPVEYREQETEFQQILQTLDRPNNTNNKEIQKEDFKLIPLHPYTFEFNGENDTHNRIDYFYLSGTYLYNPKFYHALNKVINKKQRKLKNNLNLYSIYVYTETDELNNSYNKPREFFDGKNKDLIAYVRFTDSINDIFYILDNGIVVYDCVENKPLNFEFDQ